MEQSATNLGIEAQSRSLRAALILLAVSLGLAIVLVQRDLGWAYRLVLFVPFSLTAINLYQGLFKT